jgi:hypothetical protein
MIKGDDVRSPLATGASAERFPTSSPTILSYNLFRRLLQSVKSFSYTSGRCAGAISV